MRYRLTVAGGNLGPSEYDHWDDVLAAYRERRGRYTGQLWISGCATNARGICIGQWKRVDPDHYQGEASNNG